MKTTLKTFNALMVSILLTTAQLTWAKQSNGACAQRQQEIFEISVSALQLSSTLSHSQKVAAVQFDKSGYGPGPGELSQLTYLAQLDAKDRRIQQLVRQAKDDVKRLLSLAPECFNSMTAKDIEDLTAKLSE